jgi:hypothetical protein
MISPTIFSPSMLKSGLPMPSYACMGVDQHPMYQEFVEPCMRQWHNLGIHPCVFNITDKDESTTELEYGTIHNIKKHPTLPTWFQSQYVRLYGLSKLNGICVISDIDLFPLDARFYSLYASLVNRDNFVHTHTRFPYRYPRYVFNPFFGYADTLCKFLNVSGTFYEFMDFVTSTVDVSWNSDEAFLHKLLGSVPMENRVEHSRSLVPMIAPYRLFRNEPAIYDQFVDFHCPRPHAEHKKYIDDSILRYTVKF